MDVEGGQSYYVCTDQRIINMFQYMTLTIFALASLWLFVKSITRPQQHLQLEEFSSGQ